MRMASWNPRQKALSVRARSAGRAPRVGGGQTRCVAASAAAGALLHTSFVRADDAPCGRAVGRPRSGKAAADPVPRWPRVFGAPSRRSRVFCKVAHPGKLVTASFKVRESCGARVLRFSDRQGCGCARVLRCVALGTARPTAVARGTKCTDSAPGGGSAALGPASKPRAEARRPTRTERTLTGLVRGNATRRRLGAAVHISRFWRSGGFWRLGIVTYCCSAIGWRGRESAGFRARWRRSALASRRTPPGDRFASWVPRVGADLGRSAAGVLGSRPRTVLGFWQYPRSDLGATSAS